MDLRSDKVGDRFPARNSTANFFRFTTCTPSSREARAAFPIALGDLFCSESQYIKLIDQNAAQVSRYHQKTQKTVARTLTGGGVVGAGVFGDDDDERVARTAVDVSSSGSSGSSSRTSNSNCELSSAV